MNDPLSFKNAISKTNISDLLIFYLLKNKNPIILNYFEKISRYQNIIFNFDEFIICRLLLFRHLHMSTDMAAFGDLTI